jgi:uncharacterized membrane protein YhaH (DUF805 family)
VKKSDERWERVLVPPFPGISTSRENLVTSRIFISYRRGLNAAAAGRLYDHLREHFGHDAVFMDVDGIEPGADFVATLEQQVSQCAAFLTVIGPGWADVRDSAGRRRLDDPRDYVRVEIEAALRRDIRVVPVLVDEAPMPSSDELPGTLAPLARRQAVEIAHPRFVADVDQLARSLGRVLGVAGPSSRTADAPSSSAPIPAISADAPRGLPTRLRASGWMPQMPLIDLLFSFQGRVSRRPYWLAALGVLAAAVAFQMMLVLTLLAFIGPDAYQSRLTKFIALIGALPFYWPTLALFMKRLHDIDQGWGMFLPLVWLTVVQVGLDIAGYRQGSLIPLAMGIGACVIIGWIPGTRGPNTYGPDPQPIAQSSDAPGPAKG